MKEKKKDNLIKLVDWMVERKGIVALIILGLFIVPLLIVHILFKIRTDVNYVVFTKF